MVFCSPDCSEIGVIQLRNNLVFIIDNLQYYLQVDVMESQYTTMEAGMRNTENFEDIQKAHTVFLANVMSQTFLLSSGAGKKNPVSLVVNVASQPFIYIDALCSLKSLTYYTCAN